MLCSEGDGEGEVRELELFLLEHGTGVRRTHAHVRFVTTLGRPPLPRYLEGKLLKLAHRA